MHKKQALCEAVLPVWVEQMRLAQSGSEKAVFDMMNAFSSLVTPDGQVDNPSSAAAPADLVEQMFRGFQYQDRLSQILAILIRDMERMHQTLVQPGIDEKETLPGAWMERLQQEFVMQAQRQPDLSDPAATTGDAQRNDDLTFF